MGKFGKLLFRKQGFLFNIVNLQASTLIYVLILNVKTLKWILDIGKLSDIENMLVAHFISTYNFNILKKIEHRFMKKFPWCKQNIIFFKKFYQCIEESTFKDNRICFIIFCSNSFVNGSSSLKVFVFQRGTQEATRLSLYH